MEFVTDNQRNPKRRQGSRGHEPALDAGRAIHPVLELHQQSGNQALQQLLRGREIQAKLAVNQPGDPEEQEADAVADRVMRSPAGAASCAVENEDEKTHDTFYRTATGQPLASSANGGSSGSHIVGAVLNSPGDRLDASTRAFFEPRFGRDFSAVRVHTDATAAASARAIQAHAYATGDHLVFDSGKFAPESEHGRRLLAHELTHTIQQKGRAASLQRQPQSANPSRPSTVNSSSSSAQSPSPDSKPLEVVGSRWPYPAIAAALPPEVVALRASASLRLPLAVLLRPDMRFDNRQIWNDYLANRRNHGDAAEAAELLRNEMMRQYFSGEISLKDTVEIDVTPPISPGEPPTVDFRLHGKSVYTPDGMIGAAELSAIQSVGSVVKKVQRDAASVEMAGQLLDALDVLEPAVEELKRVYEEPEDFALHAVYPVQYAVQKVKPIADDWGCQTGPALTAAANLNARYETIYAVAFDAARFLTHWHTENTMESAGQANLRRGINTSHTSVRALWGIVDVGETILSLGSHTSRTEISEAYEDGRISWNEAKGLVSKVNTRAMLSALALRAGGIFGRGIGGGILGGLEIAGPTAGIIGGSFVGVTSATAMMASQNLITTFGGGQFSAAGEQIWNAGAPGGKQWAIGLAFSAVQGAGQPLNPRSMAPLAEPPLVETSPSAGSLPRSAYVGPSSGLFGLTQKLAIWSRLRLGQPIMQGSSGINLELVSGASNVPGEVAPGPTSSAPRGQVANSSPRMQPVSPSAETPDAPTSNTPIRDVDASQFANPDDYLNAIRTSPKNYSVAGQSWNYSRFPRGPNTQWRPGDPIDMPKADGTYPTFDVARPRLWRNRAAIELEARANGSRAQVLTSTDPITSMSDGALATLRDTATSRVRSTRDPITGRAMEIEHFGVQQKVGRWLERAGFSSSDARQLSGVADPNRLLDVSPVEHAFFDAGAHGFGSLRADPTGARWADTPWADPRVANPLEFMTDSEIAEIVRRARSNPSINLSAVPELLSALRREIAARGLPIQLP